MEGVEKNTWATKDVSPGETEGLVTTKRSPNNEHSRGENFLPFQVELRAAAGVSHRHHSSIPDHNLSKESRRAMGIFQMDLQLSTCISIC